MGPSSLSVNASANAGGAAGGSVQTTGILIIILVGIVLFGHVIAK